MDVMMPTSRVAPPPAPKKKREPKASVNLDKLAKAIQNDRHDLGAFREKRYAIVQQAAGENYGNNASTVEMPVNLLNLYFDVMTSAVIANQPRVMAKTFDEKQIEAVDAWEGWENQELIAMDAASIFRRAFQDSLSWMGIVRVALADTIDAEASGWGMKAGQPFMESIDPDDWVGDQGARIFDRMSYSGCRYRCPVDLANDLYKSANKFEPDDQSDYNYGGDPKIETIGRTPGWREEVEDFTTLWEVWLPKYKEIIILRDSGGVPDTKHGPVAVKKWIGPARGPYHYLGLNYPSGNLNPNGPANHVLVLNANFNSAWRKLLRETRDYKKLTLYSGSASKDAERVKNAKDGTMVQVDCDPTQLAEREFGGAGNAVWAMARAMQEAFNFIGGNLALLGGRAAKSDTATQDKILNQNAGASVASIQERVYAFMAKCLDSHKWFTWNHPQKVMKSEWQSESYPDMRVQRELHPWNSPKMPNRAGPMPKIDLDIYALMRQTPQSRIAFIDAVVAKITPLLPYFEKQGVMLDGNALLAIDSKLGNEPQLKKIFRFSEPPKQEGGGETGSGGKPANTTRTYQRYGAGADSEAAESANLDEQFNKLQKGPVNPNSGM